MLIRDYRPEDAPVLARLFFETVHRINSRDYSPAQVSAWAPAIPASERWHARLAASETVVAAEADRVLGFASLEADGHIDLLYCDADCIGRGVGSALLARLEAGARRRALARLYTEASITARPFFERRGYRVLRRREFERAGVTLVNFAMEKALRA